MRACLTLHRFLQPFLPSSPQPRLKLLFATLEAAVRGQRLTLTAIGRELKGRAQVKHKIKKVYRLLANKHFQAQLPAFFRALTHGLIDPDSRPVLLIDWTHYGTGHDALVAAIPHDGRALPIFVEVHPKATSGKPEVEAAFLDTLKANILPADTRPVVVTDSGFRTPWFRHLHTMGWTAVGRLQGGLKVLPITATADVWVDLAVLHDQASKVPKSLGPYWITVSNSRLMQLVVFKGTAHREPSQKRSPSPKGGKTEARYRRRAQEPWMLVCSEDSATAAQVVGWYAARMQIEETFRDDKNVETGIGLDCSRGRLPEPLRGLRLIGALASLVTHVVGQLGENLGLHQHYQVNTVRERRVLSLPFLARQMLKHEDYRLFSAKRLQQALEQIKRAALASSICWTPDS